MNKSQNIDARKYMDLAVKIMINSVPEPRLDGKVSPKVGAVLIKPDGSVDTASRGEFRHGDHAEYTLLDKKNRNVKLDGSKLFATLEPCAPGSRRHPKLDCSERIVNARISEVWVGIEDPDPQVDRKGIKFMQDHGIKVYMFDADLQEVIRKENEIFLKQAEERARKAKEETKVIQLSQTENVLENVSVSDFSEDALNKFIQSADIAFKIDSPSFHSYLHKLGILEKDKNKLKPTGLGILLFGKNVALTFPNSAIKAEFRINNSEPEIRDFSGPLVLMPSEIEIWLKDKLAGSINREQFERTQEYKFPITVLREAVINAIVHRDYDISGANIYINIDDNNIIIKSPGAPVPPLTLEQFQNFSAPSLSRNPKIMYVFNQMKLVEQRGIGFKSFKDLPNKDHFPLPVFSFEAPYLTLTFLRHSESLKDIIGNEKFEKLNNDEKKGILYVYNKKEVTKTEYAQQFGFNEKKAQRHLAKFRLLDLVRQEGGGPASRYLLIIDKD